MSVVGGIGAEVEAAFANAIKASGVIVEVVPDVFHAVLGKIENPLVVYSEEGFFSTNYHYLVSYKGFAFVTISPDPISLPPGVETILAEKIWVPQ